MLGAFTVSCGDDDDDDERTQAQSIAALASSTSNLSSLAAAIESAGLTETLSGTTQYTVFAPTG